ncbi:MAG: response regulator transcription factor [Thermoleophilia bacterium]|nr:response regulator transcription factor [Thermoleophilia bacterium]
MRRALLLRHRQLPVRECPQCSRKRHEAVPRPLRLRLRTQEVRDHRLDARRLGTLTNATGHTLTRSDLLARVRGGGRCEGDRFVDVLVRRLRHTVDEEPGLDTYVPTEHTQGYRLAAISRAFPVGRCCGVHGD